MQTIGERLEEARKKKGISIREAAEATKIRGDYLSKFENNQFDINLTEIYVRGFLRTYAQFLRLPADRILNDYAALGRGEARPRQPNREIYGRMDVSISSADEHSDNPPAAEENTSPAPAAQRRNPGPARKPAAASPINSIDPALVFKVGKIVGLALVAVLAIWGIVTLIGGAMSDPPKTASSASPVTATPAEPTITLVALDRVTVTVRRQNPDKSEGELLYQGTLLRGQTQVVPRPGPLFLNVNPAEKLEIEVHGKRYPTNHTGAQRLQIQ